MKHPETVKELAAEAERLHALQRMDAGHELGGDTDEQRGGFRQP